MNIHINEAPNPVALEQLRLSCDDSMALWMPPHEALQLARNLHRMDQLPTVSCGESFEILDDDTAPDYGDHGITIDSHRASRNEVLAQRQTRALVKYGELPVCHGLVDVMDLD